MKFHRNKQVKIELCGLSMQGDGVRLSVKPSDSHLKGDCHFWLWQVDRAVDKLTSPDHSKISSHHRATGGTLNIERETFYIPLRSQIGFQ